MKTLLKPFQILWQGQQGLSIHGHQSKEITSTWRPISPITQIVLNKFSVGCNKQKRSQNFFLSVQALFCWAQCLHVLAQPTPTWQVFRLHSETNVKLSVHNFPILLAFPCWAQRLCFLAQPNTTSSIFLLHCESNVGWDKQSIPNTFLFVQALSCWALRLRVLAQPTTTSSIFILHCETNVGWDKQSVPNTIK